MLPKTVEEQARLADELHQQAYGNPDQSAPEQPVQEPPNQPEQVDEPAQPVQQQPAEDAAYWKNRFEVLEGKYRAEVPRYAEEVRQMRQQIQDLQSRLEAQPQQLLQEAAPSNLVEKYGEEFVEDIRKLIPQQDDRLVREVEEVKRTAQQITYEKFLSKLTEMVPGWERQNTDQGFLSWLGEVDQFAGRTRGDLLNEAHDRLDVSRVAAIFSAYNGNNNQSKEQQLRKTLETQVAPSTTKATVAPPGKKIWQQAEVAKFYEDYRKGRISEADAARVEQDIFAAQAEGRLR